MGGNEGNDAMDKKKVHRERHSGRKAEKKKEKKDGNKINTELTDKQKNPKAFAFNSAIRAERRFRRKQDIETKKQHIPVIDRTPIEPPPILIAVVGPPKVGKSTVINNLIKLFTKSPLTDIKGPVTIVTGKKRRITLVECNNDINSMIDIAKVADLVLLLCDASFGFEMEIFEFLNICQVHGMPRIMGVLTHLDVIKNSKTLKNTKKVLKHRFWTEVYPGAKLFYLSGIVHGEYLRNEIKNLGRFISIIKFRPLTWRTTHSYLLGDRYEDLTNQELVRKNPKCDRNVSLYGYVRGVPLVKNTSVHIAGLGDLKIHDITYLPDPCPLPEVLKKRSLIEKEKFIYAPFSGVGGIVYDKDAVYVELGGSHSHKVDADVDDESKNMVSNLIDTKETLDMKMQHSEMQIFSGGRKLTAKDIKEKEPKNMNSNKPIQNIPRNAVDSDLEEELHELRKQKDYSGFREETIVDDTGRTRRRVIFNDSDDDVAENLQEDDDSDSNDSSDEGFEQKNIVYTTLKQNKDLAIHEKITSALKYFDKKKPKTQTSDFELEADSDGEDSEDDDSEESDDEISEENSAEESDIPDDISLESNESLVGVSKMKKHKEKLISVEDICEDTNKNETNSSSKHIHFKDDDDDDISSEDNEVKSNDNVVKSNKKSQKTFDTNKNENNSSSKHIHFKDDGDDDDDDDDDDDVSLEDNKVESDDNENLNINSENEEFESEDEDDEDDMAVKWKENLHKKARDAFLDRQRTTQNIMKLVYGVFDKNSLNFDEEALGKDEIQEDDIGGLFRLVTSEQKRKNDEKERMNIRETSLFNTWDHEAKDWLDPENKILIENCFVTGKWKQSEDASELLKLDDMKDFSDDDSEIFGDFEDLETGEKHTAEPKSEEKGEKRKRTESDSDNVPLNREALAEKKRKLKEKFDSEYDNTENSSYYDDLKTSAEKQAQINKEVFENMPDDLRVQIEGFRPGMYVRIEFQDVPAEFITNFDPTYPLLIGALNIGEENIGYVNVKIKKHRWYKKILKTNDTLIISLGWRRFQTIPLFSKLEDDLKYSYLKYTPEHVNCNAHFWGPITPQGTGFLALQSVNGTLEHVKQQGFRIAATGSVAELDKSTQIMKKLKLIGHPMKIYKKTAFIKDMFNSALEVAKFEGAKLRTVSGIRGQIKKASNKPEGCFRATFEDKILLSDIVFCRTWYKVDVPKFYCPVTTLLLPHEKKNAWQGVRTTGQLKREKEIKNEPSYDSLYKPIEREPKVFKPLVVPRKLQRQLPYRDKPKFAPLKSERKPNPEKKRIAVVREPHEQKVAQMLKMLRASYEHKQGQLKAQMSERVSKHKADVEAIEVRKQLKEKREKKEVFRKKSKAKIREEKKGGK